MKRKNVKWKIDKQLMNEVDLPLFKMRNSVIAQEGINKVHTSIRQPINSCLWAIANRTAT